MDETDFERILTPRRACFRATYAKTLTRLIQGRPGSVDPSARLARGIYLLQERKTSFFDGQIHGVAIISDYKIHVLRWIGQSLLPQALGVGRLFPGAVVPFVDHLPQGHSCLLKDSYVSTEEHQVPGIARQGGDDLRD